MAAFSNPYIHFHGSHPRVHPYDGGPEPYKGSSASYYYEDPDLYCGITFSDPKISGNNVSVTISKCSLWGTRADWEGTYFKYPIQFRASLGSKTAALITKPSGVREWADNTYKLNSSVTITAPIPSNGKIHFAVQVSCGCPCSGSGHAWKDVIGQDLTLSTGYTITWDASGGSFSNGSDTLTSKNVPAGADMSKYVPSENPELWIVTGWSFSRWVTDAGDPIPSKTEAKNVTYYAEYVEALRVHWVYNGGTDGTPSRTDWDDYPKRGESVQFNYTLTRSGYEFSGWKDETDNTIYPDMNLKLTNIQRRYNLTAQWKPLSTGKLIYETHGGTPVPPDQDLTSDRESRKVNDKIIPGKKIFIHFRVTQTGGNGPNPADVTLTMPLDYYSPNRYSPGSSSVKYQPGDYVPDSWTQGTLTAIYKNATFTSMSLPPDPTHPDGLKFLGWATQTSGYGNIGTKSSNILPITLSSDTTYYATWEQKLEYDPNGGVKESDGSGYARVEAEKSSSGTILAKGEDIFPNCKWIFLGWDTDPDAIRPQYSAGDQYSGNASVLYAIWKRPDVKVTFKYKGGMDGTGSLGPKIVTVPYGGSATPPTGMHKTASDGTEKRFGGWFGKYQNVTKDSIVLAMWESSPIWIWTGSNWIPYFAGVGLNIDG